MKNRWLAVAIVPLSAGLVYAEEEATRVFRHTAGLEFAHPHQWTARSEENRVQVIPNGIDRNESGEPLELLLFTQESAAGVATVSDPRVAAYLEAQLKQWLPGVDRIPESRPVKTGLGPGLALRFKGKNSGNIELQVEAYVVLHAEAAIVLIHAARPRMFSKRQQQATGMFASLTKSAPRLDRTLVTGWRRSTYFRSGPGIGSSGSLSSTTWYYLQFHGDGTFQHTVRDRMFGNTSDLGVILNKDSGSKMEKGRWNASEGILRLDWEDGSSESHAYLVEVSSIEGTTLRLTRQGSGSKPMYFHQMQAPPSH